MDQSRQLTRVKRGRLLDKDMEPVRERPRNVASLLGRWQCDESSIRLEASKLVNRGSNYADVPLRGQGARPTDVLIDQTGQRDARREACRDEDVAAVIATADKHSTHPVPTRRP